MKFFDIRGYVIFNVYIAYFSNFSTIGTYHMCLLVSVASLILRYVTELVVYHKVRVDKQRNCVVNSCTADPEFFLLFKNLLQVAYLEVAVERIYRVQYGISLRSAPAFVFL